MFEQVSEQVFVVEHRMSQEVVSHKSQNLEKHLSTLKGIIGYFWGNRFIQLLAERQIDRRLIPVSHLYSKYEVATRSWSA